MVKDDDGTQDSNKYNILDLLLVLRSRDVVEFEIAMLSALLVFKDVCPGYRIRSTEEITKEKDHKEVHLKKETKSLRDFECSLLKAYKTFLNILQERILEGLGVDPTKPVALQPETGDWSPVQQLGLSALRCQCELLRSLTYFNYRSLVLQSVVQRGGSPTLEVQTLCCETLCHLFAHDHSGEVSYEAVSLISKRLQQKVITKDLEALLRTLKSVKLSVHADLSRTVHNKAKMERKKRKKLHAERDEVQIGLLEASATSDENNKKRFQADSLQEITLIYFRIVKGKVGFSLLPAALEGLGAITHLINIDTVDDLLAVLRAIVEAQPPPAAAVQLLCIHASLRTLAGPGQELKIDDEVFIVSLKHLLNDLPSANFQHWDVLLDCLDMALLQRREERQHVVVGFVKGLFLCAVHISGCIGGNDSNTAAAMLAMIHAILLRYPRVRGAVEMLVMMQNLNSGSNSGTKGGHSGGNSKSSVVVQEDDQVEDLAMKALRDNTSDPWESEKNKFDGSFALALLKHHVDKRFATLTSTICSNQLLPIPLRIADAAESNSEAAFLHRFDTSFQSIRIKRKN
mmetsp:Transcript_22673/g.31108  ORF Transcript_22673/g.31108 Transcript_22673/m.31108 type:complete len:572 (-) Transcript_22673:246-1961(-)